MARSMLSVCFVLFFFVKVSAHSPSHKRKSVFVFLELNNKNRLIKKYQEQRIQIAISCSEDMWLQINVII